MTPHRSTSFLLFTILLGCTSAPADIDFRPAPCSDSSSSDGGEPEPPPTGVPIPTNTCPTILDGDNMFCPAGFPCRTALVVNRADADGTGPLVTYLTGTYENAEGVLPWDPIDGDPRGTRIRPQVEVTNGLLIFPRPDPAAIARTNNPFPWWMVCGDTPSDCNRMDDVALIDEIVACAVEQDLVDPTRLAIAGMSAGGIMTTHMLRLRDYFAKAVVWSGGMPFGDEMTPAGNGTAVLVFHGGVFDTYQGAGSAATYAFQPPSEALAIDLATAGNFVIVCDHNAGHAAAMANNGGDFLTLAQPIVPAVGSDLASLQSYPFSGGSLWMFANYGCYDAGGSDPWQ